MHLKFLHGSSVSLFAYLLIIMQPTAFICQKQQSQNFMVSNSCPAPEDAMQCCHAVSRIKCAAECNLSPECIGFSYYVSSRLCHFYSFAPLTVHYDSDCIFMMNRDSFSGLPTIGLPLPNASDWIIIMNRFDGSMNFSRSWIEYKNGFGDSEEGEFWLGNEKVHLLTNRSAYTLRIEVQPNTTGGWYYADYASFSLDSESKKYALRLSGFSGGDAGDSLTNSSLPSYVYHGGMNFTTWDKDNDRWPDGNCASLYPGGWWYNSCRHACLTCPYITAFNWRSLSELSPDGLLRAARMMIRSK